MKKYFLIIQILLILHNINYAQKESNNWYFGNKAGISFSNGYPSATLNGELVTYEGCGAISDCNGNLLFYTDGVKVYNRNHQVMPNGTGLFGHTSSSQSAMIVPQPGNQNIYYLFTTDDRLCTNGFCYSVVDLSLQGGMGDITSEKNVSLLLNFTEKLSAAKHSNGIDIWIVTHEFYSNSFMAYLLTDNGLVTTPVISSVGQIHQGVLSNKIGNLKISPDGDKIACAICRDKTIEVFHFDNSTGLVTDTIISIYNSNYLCAHGVEFSPDGTKLYTTNTDTYPVVDQFNLSAGSPSLIISSRTQIATQIPSANPIIPYGFGDIQIGPDQKIYVCKNDTPFISVINNPNNIGTSCNYLDNAVSLNNRKCYLGLPNIRPNISKKSTLSFQEKLCSSVPVQFSANIAQQGASIIWNFGDIASGVLNTSDSIHPSHIFSSSGTFQIKLIVYGSCSNDTIIENIVINPSPPTPAIFTNSPVCENGNLYLMTPTVTGATYSWGGPDGFVSNMQSPTIPDLSSVNNGVYSLVITDSDGCSSLPATANIQAQSVPVPQASCNTVCSGETLFLSAYGSDSANYQWYGPGGFASVLQNPVIYNCSEANSGIYSLTAVINGCTSDTAYLNVSVNVTHPEIFLGNDTATCSAYPLVVQANYPNSAYLWSTGDTSSSITINTSGTYSVKVTNNCGFSVDSISVSVLASPDPPKTGNEARCGSGTLPLSAGNSAGYHWYSSEYGDTLLSTSQTFTTPYLIISQSFWVAGYDGTCESERVQAIAFIAYIPQTPSIIQIDSVTLRASVTANYYDWIRDTVFLPYHTQQITVNTSGHYSVRVKSIQNCYSDFSQVFHYQPDGIEYLSDEDAFCIYPNPVKNVLSIPGFKHKCIKTEMYDITGKLVKTTVPGRDDNLEINTSDINPGFYLLKIITAKKVFSAKIQKL